MSHYEERLEADLTSIRERLEDLAEQVEGALTDAIQATLSGDEEKAYLTVLGDNAINRNSRALDRQCHAFIARHLPSAGHLRLMSSIVRVNVALERVGDYAVTICRESARLAWAPDGVVARHMHALSGESLNLLSQSITAFHTGNAQQARDLMPLTARVESMMDGVYDELIESGHNREPKELVALFVIFNFLKRVSDQAKNICDQTVFAVDGETKPTKNFRILFLDDDNTTYGQMAQAIARKRFSDVAFFDSAGRDEADGINADMSAFMKDRGFDLEGNKNKTVRALELDLPSFDVIVSLSGSIKSYFLEMPFHTSGLRWDVAPLPEDTGLTQAGLENLYRDLVTRIDHLMQILVGHDD